MEVDCTESGVAKDEKSPPKLVPDSKVVQRFSPIKRQLFVTSASLVCAISGGMVVGFSAIFFPQINANKEFNFTADDESWIASMAALPMAPGCILIGIIMETLGRKAANIIVSIPFTVGWILVYFANGFVMLLLGRFLQGISLGMTGPLNSVYIGETTDPLHRGYLLGGVSFGYTLGILTTHILGTYIPWRATAIICGAINILSFIVFIFSPESPSYLLSKNKVDAAYKAFCWLRGYEEKATNEFQSMVLNHKLKSENEKGSFTENICQPEFYKPLTVLMTMFFVLQFVGVNVVAFYTVSLMRDTLGGALDEFHAMILMDVVRFVMTVIVCILIKNVKRRPLFLVSGYGTAVCMILLAIFCYISNKYITEHFSFLPIIFFMGYICFTSLGLLPLPWCLVGELFPLKSRGLGSGITTGVNFVFFFLAVKIAPFMFEALALEGTFLFYGLVALIGTFVLSLILPETKNKTLQEIENEFRKNN
ncbi:facilitated trehalose transporter Tret1-like isoform X2 [Hermetia illucens]|nr:facilitated trehalose transporter Tret1-like isoform X2 [Hermetia illucens]